MNSMRIVLNYSLMKIKSYFKSQKIVVLAVYVFLIMFSVFKGIRNFAITIGYNISPFSYPHLISTHYMKLLIMVGAVILFLDAPFINDLSINLMTKMKKKYWIISNSFYIFLMSIFYTALYNVFLLVGFIGVQTMIGDWGKLMYTVARNASVSREFDMKIIFNPIILDRYSPLQGMTHSILLSILEFAIIGMIIMTVSLFFKSNMPGIIAASVYILFEDYLSILGNLNISKYVPVTYVNLGVFESTNTHFRISLTTAYFVLISIVIALMIISMYRLYKMDVEIYKEIE